jgi:hypothetical protein
LDNDGVYGEIGVRATNGDEVGATPTFLVNNTLPGTYPISVRVTDSFGMSSRAFTSMRIAKIGDLNFDNQISIADFIQLASHFGQSPATWEDGDLNGDGAVTIADFIVLAANFGQSSAAAATPEAALSSTLTARKHGRTGSHHRFQRHKRPIQPTLLAKGWAEKR